MLPHSFIRPGRAAFRWLSFELLEPRRVLDCHGLVDVGLCVPGDSDGDGEFDQEDLVQVLQADKYLTGAPAVWREGDWNRDGVFDQHDVKDVLQAGTYAQGVIVDDLSSLVANVPAHSGPFGPPIVISNPEQLRGAISDSASRDAVADATDFARQKLLLFSWSGSGGDRLIGQPRVVAGRTHIAFRFQFGLTDDLRQHQALFAVLRDAGWHIDIADRVVHEDTARYQFVSGASQLLVTGGLAGVHDEYRIEGSLELTRYKDGTAHLGQVEATLRGDGLSGLDGASLDSVLSLSGLSGLQTGDSSVAFAGQQREGNVVVRLQLFATKGSLIIRGGSIPPCCDFFVYTIDGTATSSTG